MKTFVKHLSNALIIYLSLSVLTFVSEYFQHDNIEHIRFYQGAFFINHLQISKTLHESWKLIFILFLGLSYKDIKERLKPYW